MLLGDWQEGISSQRMMDEMREKGARGFTNPWRSSSIDSACCRKERNDRETGSAYSSIPE